MITLLNTVFILMAVVVWVAASEDRRSNRLLALRLQKDLDNLSLMKRDTAEALNKMEKDLVVRMEQEAVRLTELRADVRAVVAESHLTQMVPRFRGVLGEIDRRLARPGPAERVREWCGFRWEEFRQG